MQPMRPSPQRWHSSKNFSLSLESEICAASAAFFLPFWSELRRLQRRQFFPHPDSAREARDFNGSARSAHSASKRAATGSCRSRPDPYPPPLPRRQRNATVFGACVSPKHSISTVRERRATIKQWRTTLGGSNAAQKHPRHRTSEARAPPSNHRCCPSEAHARRSVAGRWLSGLENSTSDCGRRLFEAHVRPSEGRPRRWEGHARAIEPRDRQFGRVFPPVRA